MAQIPQASWARWARWAAGIAAVAVALALVVWLLPPLLTNASADVSDAERLAAENRARDTLVKLAAGLVLLVGLVYTARTFRTSVETLELSRQGLLTQRFTSAVEQLGHSSSDVHIGAIHTLAGIAREEPSYVVPVTEILTAFVREHAREPHTPKGRPKPLNCENGTCHVVPPTDIQAAVAVLGRRFRVVPLGAPGDAWPDPPSLQLDFTGAYLHGVDIRALDLRLAELQRANLGCAKAHHAKLQHANLRDTKLQHADLGSAWLDGSDLGGAHLTDANLLGTHFNLAVLGGADLHTSRCEGMTVARATYSSETTWPNTRGGPYAPKTSGAFDRDSADGKKSDADRLREHAELQRQMTDS